MGACLGLLCGTDTVVGVGLFATGTTATAIMTANRRIKVRPFDEDDPDSRHVRHSDYKTVTPENQQQQQNKKGPKNIIEYMNAEKKGNKSKHGADNGPQHGKKGRHDQAADAPLKKITVKNVPNNRVHPRDPDAAADRHRGDGFDQVQGIHREIRPKNVVDVERSQNHHGDGGEGYLDVEESHRGGRRGPLNIDEEAPAPIEKREESWIMRLGNNKLAQKLSFLRDRSEEARIRRRASMTVNK
jgi:hypothetical protein